MTPPPTLYLHIGMHKTGTTALQQFFLDNRDAFKQAGLLYPQSGILDIGHHALVAALLDEDIPWITLTVPKQQIIANLLTEMANHPQHDVLLSAENFPRIDPRVFSRLFAAQYTVRVVIYLRRQDKLLNSHYNQLLKARYETGSIQELLASDFQNSKSLAGLNFARFIQPWEETFGRHRLVVRIYEKHQLQGTLYEDFLNAIDKTLPESMTLPEETINPSLGLRALKLLQLSNHFAPIPEKHRYIELMAQWLNDVACDGAPMLLTTEEIRSLLTTYDTVNQTIARDYLGRSDGRLFFEDITPASGEERELTRKDLAEMLVQLWRFHLEQLAACPQAAAPADVTAAEPQKPPEHEVLNEESLSVMSAARELARRLLMKLGINRHPR